MTIIRYSLSKNKKKKIQLYKLTFAKKKIPKSIESRGRLLDKEFIQEMASIRSFNMIICTCNKIIMGPLLHTEIICTI